MDRNPEATVGNNTLPPLAMAEAMGELREVMIQYTSYTDPSESAARKERLRQAEEAGQLEETAAHIVRASLANQPLIEENVMI